MWSVGEAGETELSDGKSYFLSGLRLLIYMCVCVYIYRYTIYAQIGNIPTWGHINTKGGWISVVSPPLAGQARMNVAGG